MVKKEKGKNLRIFGSTLSLIASMICFYYFYMNSINGNIISGFLLGIFCVIFALIFIFLFSPGKKKGK